MTREEVTAKALMQSARHKCVVLELPTGYGKTKIAIDIMRRVSDKVSGHGGARASVLILVPQVVLRENWLEQLRTWGGTSSWDVTIECYDSLGKYVGTRFDIVICDEGHHLSELRRSWLGKVRIRENIVVLSATLSVEVRQWLWSTYDTGVVRVSMQEAMREKVLPDPAIYLFPLRFDSDVTECILRNTGKGLPKVSCGWAERWKYLRRKDVEVAVHCTKSQYYESLSSEINWYRQKAMMRLDWARNKWLRLCGDRLKWLAGLKDAFVLDLLERLEGCRTLTFCAGIEQANILGENCVHSGNDRSGELVEAFNNKEIDHLTSCRMLDEGINLVDCQVGIFAAINASDRMTIQKLGRILRHERPVIMIPYYEHTREEELVKAHLAGYDRGLVMKITDIDKVRLGVELACPVLSPQPIVG